MKLEEILLDDRVVYSISSNLYYLMDIIISKTINSFLDKKTIILGMLVGIKRAIFLNYRGVG